MPRLIYRDGPPSVGLVVREIMGKDKATGKPLFGEGQQVTVERGKPSPDLPDHVVDATLKAQPAVADWKLFKEPSPKAAPKEKKGGDS